MYVHVHEGMHACVCVSVCLFVCMCVCCCGGGDCELDDGVSIPGGGRYFPFYQIIPITSMTQAAHYPTNTWDSSLYSTRKRHEASISTPYMLPVCLLLLPVRPHVAVPNCMGRFNRSCVTFQLLPLVLPRLVGPQVCSKSERTVGSCCNSLQCE
jgi:hypothetical protein